MSEINALKSPPNLPSERSFGFLFVVVFAIVGGYTFYMGLSTALTATLLSVAALLVIISTFKPKLLAPFNRAWFTLGQMDKISELSTQRDKIERLRNIMNKRHGAKEDAEISAALDSELSRQSLVCTAPTGCEKESLCLDYLASLKKRKVEVVLFTVPSENALKLPLGGQDGRICGKAAAKGLKYVNLWSRLFADYHSPDGNTLYLDGAHLTVTGSKKVALWMASEMGLAKQYVSETIRKIYPGHLGV
jgi:hypothetical protein